MKLASFMFRGRQRFGAIQGAHAVDLTTAIDGIESIDALIASDSLNRVRDAILARAAGGALIPLEDVQFLPPVSRPEKVWCIGVNYGNRNAEYKDGSEPPKYPSLFVRSPSSFVGHGVPLERPTVSEQLDYEGEILLVIGRPGRHIPRDQAFDHIFGLTICNEGSVRDWLHHGKFNVTQGKNFDRSGSIGPWVVTADELDPSRELRLETRVNGEVRQRDTTANLMFPFDYLISYLSTFATLRPGDMIATGTPTGAGARMEPPAWLRPGDVVEVEVPGIGVLRNGVADEVPGAAHD
jgi:2-keto-4-pentenoate hydratase/2-oxohepta-3-ene-1,7-dioic acid hydratase in catechol pathway